MTDVASRTADQVLEEEYLLIRAKILQIAASLDRIDRAEGNASDNFRREQIERGIRLLLERDTGRAEQVQMEFSRGYDADWKTQFGLE